MKRVAQITDTRGLTNNYNIKDMRRPSSQSTMRTALKQKGTYPPRYGRMKTFLKREQYPNYLIWLKPQEHGTKESKKRHLVKALWRGTTSICVRPQTPMYTCKRKSESHYNIESTVHESWSSTAVAKSDQFYVFQVWDHRKTARHVHYRWCAGPKTVSHWPVCAQSRLSFTPAG